MADAVALVNDLRQQWQADPGRSSHTKWNDLMEAVARRHDKGSPQRASPSTLVLDSGELTPCRGSLNERWRMSFCNTPIPVSMPKCPNIGITCSKPHSVSTPVQVSLSLSTARDTS